MDVEKQVSGVNLLSKWPNIFCIPVCCLQWSLCHDILYIVILVAQMNQPLGNWQDTGRETKLWIMNSTTSFPVLLFLVNISWLTFFVVLGTMAVFFVLDYYGFKPKVFLRYARSAFAGGRKSARPWYM